MPFKLINKKKKTHIHTHIDTKHPPKWTQNWILPTCRSNKGWKARLANELTPSIHLYKCEVPDPSGSSSILFNFDSISVQESIFSTVNIKQHPSNSYSPKNKNKNASQQFIKKYKTKKEKKKKSMSLVHLSNSKR